MNEQEFRAAQAERAEMDELSDRFEAAAERAQGAGAVLDKAVAEGMQREPMCKRVHAETCPTCGGTMLATDSRMGHVRAAHFRAAHSDRILPNGYVIETPTTDALRDEQDVEDIIDSDGRLLPRGLR